MSIEIFGCMYIRQVHVIYSIENKIVLCMYRQYLKTEFEHKAREELARVLTLLDAIRAFTSN